MNKTQGKRQRHLNRMARIRNRTNRGMVWKRIREILNEDSVGIEPRVLDV